MKKLGKIARYVTTFLFVSLFFSFQYQVLYAQDFQQKKVGPITNTPPPALPENNKPKETPPEVYEAQFVDAMKYYLMEEYDKALELMLKLNQSKPNNSGLQYQISATYAKLKKFDAALTYAKMANQNSENNSQYQMMLAGLCIKNGQLKEAAKVYEKLFEKDKTNSEIGLNLAEAYMADGNFKKAQAVLEQVEINVGKNPELTEQRQLLYKQMGKFNDAKKIGDKLIEATPNDIDAYIQQAELMLFENKVNESQEYVNKALKVNPKSSKAHLLNAFLGNTKMDSEKTFQAVMSALDDPDINDQFLSQLATSGLDHFEKTLTAQQKSDILNKIIVKSGNGQTSLLLKSQFALKNDKKQEAIDYLLAYLKNEPSNLNIWMQVLQLDAASGQNKKLLEHAEMALEYFPNQAIIWFQQGFANYELRDFKAAEESLLEAERLAFNQKDLLADIASMLGETYNKLKNYEQSDVYFEKSLKNSLANYGVMNNYAYYLSLRKKNLARAEELSALVVEKNGTSATYLDTYGWVLFVKGDYAKAKPILQKAFELNQGKSLAITEHWADVLAKTNETEKAVAIWKEVLLKSPTRKILESKIAKAAYIEE